MIRHLVIFILSLLLTSTVLAKMVYLSELNGQRRVVLADDDGSFLRYLTPIDQQAYHPEISADGRFVSYSIGRIEPGLIDVAIHVQNLETGEIEVWTESGSQYIHAEFSASGQYLAYSGPVKQDDGSVLQLIHLIDLKKERARGPIKTAGEYSYYQAETEVIPSEQNSFFPAVASDGSFVVFHRTKDFSNKETAKELVLFSRYDSSSKLLTEENGHAMVPSLSADDRYVAYAGITEGQWDIHVLDLWTEQSTPVTASVAKEFTPVFAPDGSIYYSHITEGEEMGIDIYKIHRDEVFTGSAIPTPFIAEESVFEYVPSFSGDLNLKLTASTSLPAPARSSFGAITHQGLIYIAGGHQGQEHTYPPESFLDEVAVFNPTTRKWSTLPPLSHPRHGFQLVAHENYIYAFGGFAYSANHKPGWQSLDLIERFDINERSWEVLEEKLPRRRSSNTAIKVGTKVYFLGGWNSTPKHEDDLEGRFHPEVDVFDLESLRAYDSGLRVPQPLRRALTAVVINDEIYLLGGISEGSEHFGWLDHVTIFNPESGQFREGPKLPFATFAPGAGYYKGRLFLFGGMTQSFNYVSTIFEWDLAKGHWENTGRYLKENKGFPMVVEHPKGGLGILGGHTYIFHGDGKITDTPVSTFEWLRF